MPVRQTCRVSTGEEKNRHLSYSFNLTNRDMTQVKRLSTAKRLIMTESVTRLCPAVSRKPNCEALRVLRSVGPRRGDCPSSLHL